MHITMDIDSIISDLFTSPKRVNDIHEFSDQPGIYAFFYQGKSTVVNSITLKSNSLAYIGKTESSQRSRDANTHFKSGKTSSSTVRKSFGAILREELVLTPIPRNDSN